MPIDSNVSHVHGYASKYIYIVMESMAVCITFFLKLTGIYNMLFVILCNY